VLWNVTLRNNAFKSIVERVALKFEKSRVTFRKRNIGANFIWKPLGNQVPLGLELIAQV